MTHKHKWIKGHMIRACKICNIVEPIDGYQVTKGDKGNT